MKNWKTNWWIVSIYFVLWHIKKDILNIIQFTQKKGTETNEKPFWNIQKHKIQNLIKKIYKNLKISLIENQVLNENVN